MCSKPCYPNHINHKLFVVPPMHQQWCGHHTLTEGRYQPPKTFKTCLHPIAYYLATSHRPKEITNPMNMNCERSLKLQNWRPYLAWMATLFQPSSQIMPTSPFGNTPINTDALPQWFRRATGLLVQNHGTSQENPHQLQTPLKTLLVTCRADMRCCRITPDFLSRQQSSPLNNRLILSSKLDEALHAQTKSLLLMKAAEETRCDYTHHSLTSTLW